MDSEFHKGDIEVEDVAALETEEFEVCNDLGLVNSANCLDGFYLKKQTFIYYDVRTKTDAKVAPLIFDQYFNLRACGNAHFNELDNECPFVD